MWQARQGRGGGGGGGIARRSPLTICRPEVVLQVEVGAVHKNTPAITDTIRRAIDQANGVLASWLHPNLWVRLHPFSQLVDLPLHVIEVDPLPIICPVALCKPRYHILAARCKLADRLENCIKHLGKLKAEKRSPVRRHWCGRCVHGRLCVVK